MRSRNGIREMTRRRQTVLFISHDASRTGAPLFLLRFLRWFRDNSDIQFRILVGSAGELLSDFEALGTVHVFEPPRTIAYRVLRRLKLHRRRVRDHRSRLREELLRSDISLIYANSTASADMLGFLSFIKCPVICHVHELEGVIRELGPHTMPILKSRVAFYISASSAVKTNLVERHRISQEKVHLVENFIPVPQAPDGRLEHAREFICRELGIPSAAKIVCACGVTNYRKGTDLFLQVAHRVTREFSSCPVHFVWVGGGSKRATYMKQAASAGLENIVHFIGQKIDVAPYFAASDVFLLTSREEPFALVMLEAALQGNPIICFDHSGSPDFARDIGYVVPDFDVNKMSDRLIELLSSPELCRRMGIAAKKKVLDHHTMSSGAGRIASVIQQALSSQYACDVVAPAG
jgi:glycosyltransferase involved in cell wall biosynthesis